MDKTNKSKIFYKNKLPHYQPVGAAFFVTFRLFGSIPKSKTGELKKLYKSEIIQLRKNEEKNREEILSLRYKYFKKFDELLEKDNIGPHYLKEENISKIVSEQLHRFDNEFYELIAYTIMSNHVHILIDTGIQLSSEINEYDLNNSYVPLDKIMKRIKGPTAIYCNRDLNRKGKFWDRESYDVYIRNHKMLLNIISYILENPVKAGIVKNWRDYKWSYWKGYEADY